MQMPSIFAHDRTFKQPVVWMTTLIMLAFHIGAIVALFFFSWKAFLVAMVLWWIAEGSLPSLLDALERLALVESEGPGPKAFTFGTAFEPPS